MSATLKRLFLITDFGFLFYWGITVLVALKFINIPKEYLFKDYNNPLMQIWNWSFMPIDILASLTGLWAVHCMKKNKQWRNVALISMTLTFCAGFMAICFWTFQKNFDLSWWLPNLFLMLWPILIYASIRTEETST
ncbi:MAG: hypothetical protein COA43_07705 [Robiginitomaculum sp.]|nr:MAG: hypothetical protein COA43_07705 [Robiginitomaculum sp.]